jgi:RNA polymerase sigma factor (TIGR02999 family)
MDEKKGEVTVLLDRLMAGDNAAEAALMERVYVELHRIAMARLKSERGGHTLQATALVHEAYLRLCRVEGVEWQNRSHFYRVAAGIMRRILVDYARHRTAQKRGDGSVAVSFDEAIVVSTDQSQHAIEVDDLLRRLARLSPRQAQVVEMRFFGGLTEKEIAVGLGVDVKTIGRDWAKARAWLHGQLDPGGRSDGN